MGDPQGLPTRKKILKSLLLSIILIGSVISSTSLLAMIISPQQAWANHLPAPTLLAPANNAVTNDNKPDLDWSDVTGASSYRVQVDDNNDFSSITYTNDRSTSIDSNAGPGGGFADGTYFWRVASKAANPDALAHSVALSVSG